MHFKGCNLGQGWQDAFQNCYMTLSKSIQGNFIRISSWQRKHHSSTQLKSNNFYCHIHIIIMYISIKFTCDNEGHEEQAYWSLNSIFSKAISRCKMAMRYNLTLFNTTTRTKKKQVGKLRSM